MPLGPAAGPARGFIHQELPSMPRSWFAKTFALAAVLCLWAGPAPAQLTRESANLRSGPAVKEAFKPVVAGPSKSTVRVRADGKDAALGTVVAADGWILN